MVNIFQGTSEPIADPCCQPNFHPSWDPVCLPTFSPALNPSWWNLQIIFPALMLVTKDCKLIDIVSLKYPTKLLI